MPDRPPADAGESFQTDDTHALGLGMGDDIVREFMVGAAHPALLFALALAHRADLLGVLKVLALCVDAAAPGVLAASTAQEVLAFVDDMHHGRHLHVISQADADRADRWFARYGAPVAFFSRLLPVIRTYISLPAGIARMNFGQFVLFTLLGSLPWCFLLAFVGFKLGDKIVELATLFHDFDIVIGALLAVAVAYYIYHHIKKDREARSRQTTLESPRLRR